MSEMSMMVLIFLEFSQTPFAIRLISQELKKPISVPTDPKISPIIRLDRRWSSGRDSIMSSIFLTILAILAFADVIKAVFTSVKMSLFLMIAFN